MTTANMQIANRRQLKRRRVEAERALVHRSELLERIAELEKKKDGAADKHASATAPMQAELQNVEDQIVARIVDRRDADPKLDARRKALISSIEEANLALQNEIDEINQRIRLLNKELQAIDMNTPNPIAIENELFRCGDREKLQRFAALDWVSEQLRRICLVAEESRAKAESFLKQATRDKVPEQITLAENRCGRWAVTLEVLSDYRDDCRNESTLLRTNIIES